MGTSTAGLLRRVDAVGVAAGIGVIEAVGIGDALGIGVALTDSGEAVALARPVTLTTAEMSVPLRPSSATASKQ